MSNPPDKISICYMGPGFLQKMDLSGHEQMIFSKFQRSVTNNNKWYELGTHYARIFFDPCW